jgi:hypothetical protein
VPARILEIVQRIDVGDQALPGVIELRGEQPAQPTAPAAMIAIWMMFARR